MKLKVSNRNKARLIFVAHLFTIILVLPYALDQHFFELNPPTSKDFAVGYIAASICALILVTHERLFKLHDAMKWMVATSLKERSLSKVESEVNSDETKAVWPWGSHTTKLLNDLEAAAQRWWVLYDPTDPTTAPTNEMVADWLVEERAVSKEKARAIASILRADGLRTGPRG